MTEIHERSINESDFPTILCQDIAIDGKLHCEQPILIDCRFEGTLISNSKVIVFHNGFVKGTIRAKVIRISGIVEGDLIASEQIELEHCGKIFGNISSPSIVMESGSVFEGQSHVLRQSGNGSIADHGKLTNQRNRWDARVKSKASSGENDNSAAAATPAANTTSTTTPPSATTANSASTEDPATTKAVAPPPQQPEEQSKQQPEEPAAAKPDLAPKTTTDTKATATKSPAKKN